MRAHHESHFGFALVLLLTLVLGLPAQLFAANQDPNAVGASSGDNNGGNGDIGDAKLYALGGISAADLWTAYLLIGAMSDYSAKGGYDAAQLKQVLNARIKLNDSSVQNLKRVAKEVPANEQAYIRKVSAAYDAVSSYARAAITLSANRTSGNAQAYEQARQNAWGIVKRLLGLK